MQVAKATDILNKQETEKNLKKQNEELEKGLITQRAVYDLKEKQIGLLDDENEKNIKLANLYNERQKKELEARKKIEGMSDEMYQEQIKFEDDLLAKQLQRYSVTGQIIQEVSSGMKSSMMDFFDYTSAGFGKLNNLAISLGNTIYKAVVQQMVVNPLVGSLTSAATGFFSTPTATGGGTYNGVTSSAIKVESAKGNVFNSPSLSAYSNSVVSKPTMFAFANGGVPNMGVMGEKNGGSPEAIIPLTRTSNGDLGVKSISDSGSQNVKVEIINKGTNEMTVTNATSRNNMGEQVISIVIDAIQNNKMGMRTMIGGAR
jgi:phage-related minor tail protein